jgi:hypothetical protein
MSKNNLKTNCATQNTRSYVSVERAIELSKRSGTKWVEGPQADHPTSPVNGTTEHSKPEESQEPK